MAKRKTFRNDRAGVAFLQAWRENGQADVISYQERTGKLPLLRDKEWLNRGWAQAAYTDGFNAEIRRQQALASGIGMEVFGQ